jgi:pimeloyl-ACP methyl ester carboxylesterase
MAQPMPFPLQVPESQLADLRERLARTRFPDEPLLEPWSTGTSLAYLRELINYWHFSFDWRAWEQKLNSFKNYKAAVGGIDLHFIHEPGRGPNPIPLLLSHGWPGSVFEFHKLIPLLTERFTVVAPSLPGYGLSFTPGQKRLGAPEIADLFAELMTDVLGYKRFAAQGGDWGAFITSSLGMKHPQRVLGIHLNLLAIPRNANEAVATEEEKRYVGELKQFQKEEMGYQWIQGTRPQTLAYGLTDSPAGLAAWIVEKFRAWSDNDGAPESAISRDEMLANISLYWFTGAVGSSFWPYYARMHSPWPISPRSTVDVPTGYIEFPKEILRPPRSLAERTYTDIRRWTKAAKGGHFAALEQPEVLAREIQEFFSAL